MPERNSTAESHGGVEYNNGSEARVRVSEFDDCAENHFKAMDKISELCGDEGAIDDGEIQRFASSIKFLREWRFFNYKPSDVSFACEDGDCVVNGINLSQFSSANVPQKEGLIGERELSESRDFVMYVGGPVWGLDWCPRVDESSDSRSKCEYIAISAHPPRSSYHKIGAPLSGRGLVQIWCVLNVVANEKAAPLVEKPKRGRKTSAVKRGNPMQVKRPRGRPRKNPVKKLDKVEESSSKLLPAEGVAEEDCHRQMELETTSLCNDTDQLMCEFEHDRLVKDHAQICDIADDGNLEASTSGCSIPDDVALPRLVLCLAHNGKVAWDVKWRPSNAHDSKSTHRMGFLAVLLGDGSLEVWEVPLPRTIKVLYSSLHGEGTDPRFAQLKPVFRCSMLKSGGVQSIPLAVEWSPSAPHEFLLAGCHDGTVALWKFSPSIISKDTRPLLCFSADTVPIRAIAWAPVESDSESQNVILTAGHGGLKFWDIRDPYCPLWELQPALRIIYSLDWLADPGCVLLSFDDGTMRMLSLTKAVNNTPATGKPFSGTKQQGLHSFCCSSYAIWSVQVSRLTGMVAYCGADGTVLRFQLTTKVVEKDPARNRAPHFLCSSLTENESTISVNTPIANIPFPTKTMLNRYGDTPTLFALRDILSESNQSKRSKDDQQLALCNGDDSEVEDPETALVPLKRKKATKSSASGKKKTEDDEPRSSGTKENENEKRGKFEVVPSKKIAMHRVRWNMNRGSERWLCSGGAAGIVRCQEIVLSEIDQKWAMKK